MKKKLISFTVIVSAIITTLAFTDTQPSITGRVSPADAAQQVWAISSSDSVKSAVSGGSFALTVKPGTYRIIVDAKEPRKDVILDNIEVGNQPVDVGEIVIQ